MIDTSSPPVSVHCERWPNKHAYLTADAASIALRRMYYDGQWGPRLVAYPCWGGNAPHHHLGNLRENGAE